MTWATVATALATIVLAGAAIRAYSAAMKTLHASQAANEQAKRDSIAQTRPYVFAEVVPTIASDTGFDLRVTNAGRSAARDLTLDLDAWPDEPDDIVQGLKGLFARPRTLPPGSSLRVMWRLEGRFTDDTTEAGMGKERREITVTYGSDDPTVPHYEDRFDAMPYDSGIWPVAESGPEPGAMTGDALRFYRLGQALVRRTGEFGR